MLKVMIVLVGGLLFESAGVVLLRGALKELGIESDAPIREQLAHAVSRGVTSARIWLGMLCEAIYFFSLLYLLSARTISFIWPLTSLGFVITALAARIFLGEQISWLRWLGIIFVMIGAGLVTYTEKNSG